MEEVTRLDSGVTARSLIGCDLVDMAGEGDDLEFLETPAGDCASGWAQSGAMGTDGAHSGSST